jgi:hypothetical protein
MTFTPVSAISFSPIRLMSAMVQSAMLHDAWHEFARDRSVFRWLS